MPRYDARYLLGTRVLARARHVTALCECHRRYGSNAKTKQLYGTVVSVDSIQPASNKRAVTLIAADYELGGGTVKRQQLNLRLVKLAEDNQTRDKIVQVVTALVNEQNNEPTNETNGDEVPNNRGVSNEEMLAMLHSSNKEQEAAMTEETVGPPAVAALPQVLEPAQEEQRPRRFAIGGQAVAEAHGIRWFQASRIDPPLNGFVPFCLWSI
jgi:hypothetical protein